MRVEIRDQLAAYELSDEVIAHLWRPSVRALLYQSDTHHTAMLEGREACLHIKARRDLARDASGSRRCSPGPLRRSPMAETTTALAPAAATATPEPT